MMSSPPLASPLRSSALYLPHFKRQAQGRVDLELDVLSMAQRGDQHCVRFEFVDRAWRSNDVSAPEQPLLRRVVVHHSNHLKSHTSHNATGGLHDLTSSVEDNALNPPTPQSAQCSSYVLPKPHQPSQNPRVMLETKPPLVPATIISDLVTNRPHVTIEHLDVTRFDQVAEQSVDSADRHPESTCQRALRDVSPALQLDDELLTKLTKLTAQPRLDVLHARPSA